LCPDPVFVDDVEVRSPFVHQEGLDEASALGEVPQRVKTSGVNSWSLGTTRAPVEVRTGSVATIPTLISVHDTSRTALTSGPPVSMARRAASMRGLYSPLRVRSRSRATATGTSCWSWPS